MDMAQLARGMVRRLFLPGRVREGYPRQEQLSHQDDDEERSSYHGFLVIAEESSWNACARKRCIIIRQNRDQFLVEVVGRWRWRLTISVLILRATLFDVFPQAIVQVAIVCSLNHLRLIVPRCL